MAEDKVIVGRPSRTLKLLRNSGALVENSHFRLTSGLHSSAYIEPDNFLCDPEVLSELGFAMAQWIRDSGLCPDTVTGPETGGAYLAQWVAWHLKSLGFQKVSAVGLKKKGRNSLVASPAHHKLFRGKNIFIVDDVFTSGKSIGLAARLCKKMGGAVLGAICVVKRGEPRAVELFPMFGSFPIFSLAELMLPDWEESDCPLCGQGLDINTEHGHGV